MPQTEALSLFAGLGCTPSLVQLLVSCFPSSIAMSPLSKWMTKSDLTPQGLHQCIWRLPRLLRVRITLNQTSILYRQDWCAWANRIIGFMTLGMLYISLAIMKTCAAPLKEVRFRLDWSTFGEVPFSVFSLGFDLLAIDEGCRYTIPDKDNQYSRLHFPPKPIFRL